MNKWKNIDSPWRRLPWTLPGALMIWAMALWSLSYFIKKPAPRVVAPPPIDARLLEEPAPPPVQKVRIGQPAAPKKSEPTPAPPEKPSPVRKTRARPVVPKLRRRETSRPSRAVSGHTHVVPESDQRGAVTKPAAPAGGAQAGSVHGNSTTGSLDANSGARAIIRPMPQIPDELREEDFSTSVLARFHVAADGSATVELAKPTPSPRLNSIVLAGLKKWRFMPAIKNGSPVASVEDIVIKIEVK
ncbi:MAG: hypothetical protein P4L43_03080 [Syntrophobacteraceae bacterium]|nr:hypothetical protein [Syntrophobacteraceae bacterium]